MSANNWGLLGHEWAVDILRHHIQQDTVRHAYLISGPPGMGRRSLALRFAQALECPTPPSPGEACLVCRTCTQIEKMQYADLAVLQAESETGTLKVEQIRAIQPSLSLKPYQGRYRLALFLRFQQANPNAANALLKTLEEAPPQVILVLTADNPDGLLPTIVSRCEGIRLRPLPVELVQDHLESRGADPDSARLLAHLSGGRPGYALRLLAAPEKLEERTRQLDEMQELLVSTRGQRFAFAERLTKAKDNVNIRLVLAQLMELWSSYWRDVMLVCSGAGIPLTNIDRASEIEALAEKLDLSRARKLVVDNETALERLDKNVNTRLLIEVLLLDWPAMRAGRK
jgi:DNA polymerase-3 subunit delta'